MEITFKVNDEPKVLWCIKLVCQFAIPDRGGQPMRLTRRSTNHAMMSQREAAEAAQETTVLPTARRDHEIALIFLIIS
ncbi:hypothetical protein HW555_010957 [Spodoptera exigua]|uniref:Uncharacterized protein n=1 Tax=Spodoptera exigua TaxID=7107 RepID=A0A835G7V9_SPOEX|nr:hypothetical protein HW555_010957 [Spodoptera exigua]